MQLKLYTRLAGALMAVAVTGVVQAGFDEGEAAFKRQDYATARTELLPLANQGHVAAQGLLGFLLLEGRGGAVDSEEGLKWVRRAAEQGDAPAQHTIGTLFIDGKVVEVDINTAAMWFSLSAAQGFGPAQHNIKVLTRDAELNAFRSGPLYGFHQAMQVGQETACGKVNELRLEAALVEDAAAKTTWTALRNLQPVGGVCRKVS
ncbi:sel1 repeat family protein [Aromatoleum toluolicum]|nr:tetratricopeptide repeat protein [Aromatoleum toluolicum]NMF96147.2 sel1 repeat family protein [Aromatoleum toluolicum]